MVINAFDNGRMGSRTQENLPFTIDHLPFTIFFWHNIHVYLFIKAVQSSKIDGYGVRAVVAVSFPKGNTLLNRYPLSPIRVLHPITGLIIGGAQKNTMLTADYHNHDPAYQGCYVIDRNI